MKTNKEFRDEFVAQAVPFFEQHTQYWKRKMVQDMRDDIDELESRLSASIRLREILDQDLEAYKTLVQRQAELLERARSLIDAYAPSHKGSLGNCWLKDLAALGEE